MFLMGVKGKKALGLGAVGRWKTRPCGQECPRSGGGSRSVVLSYFAEGNLAVEVEKKEGGGGEGDDEPHLARDAGDEAEERPGGLPDGAEHGGPEGLCAVGAGDAGRGDAVDLVEAGGEAVHAALKEIQKAARAGRDRRRAVIS